MTKIFNTYFIYFANNAQLCDFVNGHFLLLFTQILLTEFFLIRNYTRPSYVSFCTTLIQENRPKLIEIYAIHSIKVSFDPLHRISCRTDSCKMLAPNVR
jgi:hypothetical protein